MNCRSKTTSSKCWTQTSSRTEKNTGQGKQETAQSSFFTPRWWKSQENASVWKQFQRHHDSGSTIKRQWAKCVGQNTFAVCSLYCTDDTNVAAKQYIKQQNCEKSFHTWKSALQKCWSYIKTKLHHSIQSVHLNWHGKKYLDLYTMCP